MNKSEEERKSIITYCWRALGIVIVIGIAIFLLEFFGVNIRGIIAGLGLTGFAFSFALKDAISSMIAGVMVIIHRTFSYGDYIKVKSFEGTVIRIDLRYITLKKDEKRVLIPNLMLLKTPIEVFKGKIE